MSTIPRSGWYAQRLLKRRECDSRLRWRVGVIWSLATSDRPAGPSLGFCANRQEPKGLILPGVGYWWGCLRPSLIGL